GVDRARQHVTAELVRPQPMHGAGGLEPMRNVHRIGRVRRNHCGGRRRENQADKDGGADDEMPPAPWHCENVQAPSHGLGYPSEPRRTRRGSSQADSRSTTKLAVNTTVAIVSTLARRTG